MGIYVLDRTGSGRFLPLPVLSNARVKTLIFYFNVSGVAVYSDALPVVENVDGVGDCHDGGDAVFARDDGAVREDAADLGDDAARDGKERGPYGVGERSNQ